MYSEKKYILALAILPKYYTSLFDRTKKKKLVIFIDLPSSRFPKSTFVYIATAIVNNIIIEISSLLMTKYDYGEGHNT